MQAAVFQGTSDLTFQVFLVALAQAGAAEVVPEAFEASIMLASHALALIGVLLALRHREVNGGQGLLGVSEPWVYPFLAFAPMAVAKWLGAGFGIQTGWIVLVGVLHLVALSAVVDWGRAGKPAFRAAGLYLVYLALLGPVAIGRIDAIAAFFALIGVVQLHQNRARLAMSLFTIGAWIKIWPAAAAIALFAAAKSKASYVVAAVASVGPAAVAARLRVGSNRVALVAPAEVHAVGAGVGAQDVVEQLQVRSDFAHDARVRRAGQHQAAALLALGHQVAHEGLVVGQGGRVGAHRIGQPALEGRLAQRQPGQQAQQVQRVAAHQQQGRFVQRVGGRERAVQVHVQRAGCVGGGGGGFGVADG